MDTGQGGGGVVLLGVGNVLMTDEGIGVQCVQTIERERLLPPHVQIIDGGTSTHELLGDLEDLDVLVIVDAVASGKPPGTIVRLEGTEIPMAFSHKMSPHQHGINDLLANLRLLGRAPKTVILLGAEPERIALGMELSPTLSKVLPQLVARVVEEIRTLGAA